MKCWLDLLLRELAIQIQYTQPGRDGKFSWLVFKACNFAKVSFLCWGLSCVFLCLSSVSHFVYLFKWPAHRKPNFLGPSRQGKPGSLIVVHPFHTWLTNFTNFLHTSKNIKQACMAKLATGKVSFSSDGHFLSAHSTPKSFKNHELWFPPPPPTPTATLSSPPTYNEPHWVGWNFSSSSRSSPSIM